jgi:hypothetical protein
MSEQETGSEHASTDDSGRLTVDAEVDNTERDFDAGTGRFTDSEAYDEHESTPYAGSDEG